MPGFLARPAGFVATVTVAGAVALATALVAGGLAVSRFGDWLYPGLAQKAALLGFLSSAALLLGLAAGSGLWVVLRLLASVEPLLRRPGLIALFVLATAAWLQAPLRQPEIPFSSKPVYLLAGALSWLLAAALARGREPWRGGAVLALCVSAAALLGAACWLNLVHLLGSVAEKRNLLNTALWLAGMALAALGVAVGNRGRAEASPRTGRGAVYALAGVALLAAATAAPLYRLARAAGEPPLGPPPVPVAPPAAAGVPQPLNLILISIDTLRADHVGLYGYEKDTTPHIDRFFAEAAVFTRAYAQSPWTLPTHVSMLTGQFPSTHGVRFSTLQTPGYLFPLPESAVSVAEILRGAGYRTAAFTGGSFISEKYGFAQGFERFEVTRSYRMREAVARALAWLERSGRRRFFLFLHAFDVHAYQPRRLYRELGDADYDGPLRGRLDLAQRVGPDDLGPITQQDLAHLIHLYDSELRGTDEDLSRLFAWLEESGRLGDTAVLLTSDHGEEFLEHGRTGHAFSLTEPLMRVPLLLSVPGLRRGTRIAEPVQTVDIAPTLLGLARVPAGPAAPMQGASLLPLLRGDGLPDRVLLFEADALDRQVALVDGAYKYVHHGAPGHNLLDPRFVKLTLRALLTPSPGAELYDLEADPGERENLAARRPALAAGYRERLFARLKALRARARRGALQREPLTPELAEQLRELGYLEE